MLESMFNKLAKKKTPVLYQCLLLSSSQKDYNYFDPQGVRGHPFGRAQLSVGYKEFL